MPGRPNVPIHVGRPTIRGPVHVQRTPVYRPPIVIQRTYHRPVITRPVTVVRRSPVVYYSLADRSYLQRDITRLRAEIQHTRFEDSGFYPMVRDILNDATAALNDAENMLRWGYARRDVEAAIHDAQSFLDYAQQELSFGVNAMHQYREHALAQIQEAEYFASDSYYSPRVESDLRQARQAFERGESASRSPSRRHEALRYYEDAAKHADRAMSHVYELTEEYYGSSSSLRAEHDALDDWADQLEDLADDWNHRAAEDQVEQAERELKRAKDAINRNRPVEARRYLDRAAELLESAAQMLSLRY